MKKKLPKISVMMLSYNGLEYLKKTIPPILKLDYPNYEFIIVDNGSTDGSVEFIKKFKKIKLIENGKNLGYSKGKNKGIKETKGEYILSLDNDILIHDKKLLKKLLLKYTGGSGFLQIPLIDINKEKTKYYGTFFSIYGDNSHKKEFLLKDILKKVCLVPIAGSIGGIFFIKKRTWADLGGFDESQNFNMDDFDMSSRSCIMGYKNFLYTKSYAIHLGINKTETAESYANRFKLLFSGHARSMIKNYKLINLIIRFPIFFMFQFFKAVKYSLKKRSFEVFGAFLWSIRLFFKNFPDTLKQRRIIQSKRVVKEDIFLNIKPPKFN